MKSEELPLKLSNLKSAPLEHQVYFNGRYEYGDPGWQYIHENNQQYLDLINGKVKNEDGLWLGN